MTNTYDYSPETSLFTAVPESALGEMLTQPEVILGIRKLSASRRLKPSDIQKGILNLEYTR